MSRLLTSSQDNLFHFSDKFAGSTIERAFGDMKRDYVISLWCEDITKTAVHLADTYDRFTEKFYGSILCEAVEKYSEHYTLVHHLIPCAGKLAQRIVESALTTCYQCDALCSEVFKLVNIELRNLKRQEKISSWANELAASVIESAISSSAEKKKSPDTMDGNEHILPDPHESYAQLLVQDLFSTFRSKDTTTITISYALESDKSKSSHCGSSESISSDLLSPHSTADSRGLHHFADKLLYSLSALETGSTESISSTETTDMKFSIVDCYRRSSAPELRVSSRKSSLKTVIEEMPAECTGSPFSCHNFKSYPSTSLGRRLRSSNERRCASMESIDDVPNRSSYSETLAKKILFSVYKDMM